jgi:flavorubredoxin
MKNLKLYNKFVPKIKEKFKMTTIYNDLHQFTEFIEPANLSLHQYLLLAEEPILVHTGTVSNAQNLVPQIKQLLGDKQLKYILVSHFEQDECGCLSILVKEFPGVKTICSETTARQLYGFGITYNIEIKKPGEKFIGKDYEFEFVEYPSEMHLWNGLLFAENKRGIFFSSDLMFSFGKIHGETIESNWQEAVKTSGIDWIPGETQKEKLVKDLLALSPKFIATGHGPCIKL